MSKSVVLTINAFLTVAAISFSLFVQQMAPAMVRHSNFERIRDRINDDDRDAILRSAAGVVRISIIPLIATNIVWTAFWFAATCVKTHVKSEADS